MIDTIKKLSIFKLISLALVFLCFIWMFLPWLNVSMSGLGMNQTERGNLFQVSSGECFWTVMLTVFEILVFVAILAAVFGIFSDHSLFVFGKFLDRRLFTVPVGVLAVLMFLFDAFTAMWTKGQIKDMFGGYGSYLSDIGVKVGVHIGVGAWLFLICGVAACAVFMYGERLSDGDPHENVLDVSSIKLSFDPEKLKAMKEKMKGWDCPNCGAHHSDNKPFCSSCGAKRPEVLPVEATGETSVGAEAETQVEPEVSEAQPASDDVVTTEDFDSNNYKSSMAFMDEDIFK